MFSLDFSGKVVLVTGASRGIGKAIAQSFAAGGAKVIGTATSQSGADAISEYLGEHGCGLVLNSLQPETFADFVKAVEEKAGGTVDILVNNAGIYCNVPANEIDPKLYCQVIDVNVKGTFFMCRYFCDLMIDNRFGKIINLCSAVGLRAAPGSVAYASSKFAVRGLTQAFALDLGKYNIQVNAIAPGAHKTDMYWDAVKIDPVLMETRTKQCPLQRAGEVTEMWHVVRYFMQSDFITGQVVSPNGGTTMV